MGNTCWKRGTVASQQGGRFHCVKVTFVGWKTKVCFVSQNSDNDVNRTASSPFDKRENQFQQLSEMFYFFAFWALSYFHFLKKMNLPCATTLQAWLSFSIYGQAESRLAQNIVNFCEF